MRSKKKSPSKPVSPQNQNANEEPKAKAEMLGGKQIGKSTNKSKHGREESNMVVFSLAGIGLILFGIWWELHDTTKELRRIATILNQNAEKGK
jgi:hypothetical protein